MVSSTAVQRRFLILKTARLIFPMTRTARPDHRKRNPQVMMEAVLVMVAMVEIALESLTSSSITL